MASFPHVQIQYEFSKFLPCEPVILLEPLQEVMVDNIGHPLSPQLLQVFLMTLPIFLRLLCSAKPFYYSKALTYYTFYVCASGRPKSNCDLVLASAKDL